MREVVLCADDETMRDPSLIGLEGESLESQEWLRPFSSAVEARRYLSASPAADEVWVASSNEVDPINLAAALKRDCLERPVRLIAWRESGSLMSRASAAGIDEVWGYREMARRYADLKGVGLRDNPRRRTPAKAIAEAKAREALSPADTLPFPEVGGGNDRGRADSRRNAEGTGRRGYVLTVVSASGGTGKSTVAALSALIAAGHGYRTVLLDADLQFGDAAAMLGEPDCLTVDQVVANPRKLDEVGVSTAKPVVVSAPERMEQSELYLPQLPGLIDRARETFDVVVVNTGSFWTESHIQLIEQSSNTLFLMDQRPTSVNAARRALELCSRCGVAAHPFLFAVNRCSRNPLLSSIDISCALNGVQVAEFKEGGRVVAELTGSGMASKLVEDRNDLCVSLNDFLGQVIPAALGGQPTAAAGGRKARNKRSHFRRKRSVACL